MNYLLATFLPFLFLLNACSIYPPAYKRLENYKYQALGKGGLELSTDVVFNNPNKLKFKITNIDLDVQLDNKHIAKLDELRDITVQKKSDFSIPLHVALKPDMNVIESIQKLWGVATKREANLQVLGTVKIKWLFISKELPIKIQEKVKF